MFPSHAQSLGSRETSDVEYSPEARGCSRGLGPLHSPVPGASLTTVVAGTFLSGALIALYIPRATLFCLGLATLVSLLPAR